MLDEFSDKHKNTDHCTVFVDNYIIHQINIFDGENVWTRKNIGNVRFIEEYPRNNDNVYYDYLKELPKNIEKKIEELEKRKKAEWIMWI